MAEIVFGLGASHTPMLSMGADQWPEHARLFDGDLPGVDFAARAARAEPWLDAELTLDVWRSKHEAANQCIEVLKARLREVAPDVVVIVGNDQREMFEEYTPMFALMDSATVLDLPEEIEQLPPPLQKAWWAYHGDELVEYPVETELSAHMTSSLIDRDFDISICAAQIPGRNVGHAFTFIERRVMSDPTTPIVPIMLNTYYPPNHTSARRCIELGRAAADAIKSWDSTARVAVIASGGLSHFVVDAELDRRVLDQMKSEDFDQLASIPRGELQTGTSEILNWVCAASILSAAGLTMDLMDYIPAYRSKAMTGVGLAFATWS